MFKNRKLERRVIDVLLTEENEKEVL